MALVAAPFWPDASACLPEHNITQVNSLSWTSSWRRDLNGNLTTLTYPGGATITCGYGEEDRLVKLTNNLAGGVFSFNYDAAGRLTGIDYPNGVAATNVWDLADRLTEFRHSKGGAFVLRRLGYDDADRPIREEIDAGAIPKPTGQSWRQETCDLADRVVSAFGKEVGVPATWAYGYDEAGNLLQTSRTMTGAVSTVSYTYDLAGRMTAITNGASVETYVYDAGGSRVKRVKDSATRYFALDYADGFKRPLAELDSARTVVRRYVWAGAMLLAVVESNGVVRYAHSDGQGSVLALTDSAGNVTDQFAYGPYGEPWARTGTNDLPFRWLGGSGVAYAGDGLYLTYRRLYDSSLKRFLQSDPKGIAGGLNLYAYGNLNPLVYVDPFGLEASWTSIAAQQWKDRGSWFGSSPSSRIVDRVTYSPDPAYDGRLGYVARTRGLAAAALLGLSDLFGLSTIGETFSGRNFATGQMLDQSELRTHAAMSVLTVAAYAAPAIRVTRGASGTAVLMRGSAARNVLAEGPASARSLHRFVRRLDRIGNPQQYVRAEYEQIVVQNEAGDLALFRGEGNRVAVPPGTEPVFHTHIQGPIPSSANDFMNAPVGVLQYLQAPQGGVFYMRQTWYTGFYTRPGGVGIIKWRL